jgi:hypothetical protein
LKLADSKGKEEPLLPGKKRRRKKPRRKGRHSKFYNSLTYSQQKEYKEDKEYLSYVRLQLTVFVFASMLTALFGLLIYFIAFFSMDLKDTNVWYWSWVNYDKFPFNLIDAF